MLRRINCRNISENDATIKINLEMEFEVSMFSFIHFYNKFEVFN